MTISDTPGEAMDPKTVELVLRLRTKAAMIELGEKIAWGSPPAPQPALALIEELEAALQAMMSERANGPDSYRIWGQAGTALASAKRFKGA